MDIPEEFTNLDAYCATLGHKCTAFLKYKPFRINITHRFWVVHRKVALALMLISHHKRSAHISGHLVILALIFALLFDFYRILKKRGGGLLSNILL